MSEATRILLVGATGLIGRSVMERAVGVDNVRLNALARREIPLPQGARMEMLLAERAGWPDAIRAIAAERVICALGTTQKKEGGDKAAFTAVDYELVLDVAKQAKEAGAKGFTVVSSVGANLQSKSFYLQVKGEMERALGKLGFTRLDILRPGLLKGARQGDPRALEGVAKVVSPISDLLLFGERRKYRSIAAQQVAAAALQSCLETQRGKFIHHYDQINKLAEKFPKS